MSPLHDPRSFVVVAQGTATGRCPRPECTWIAQGSSESEVGHQVVSHFNSEHGEPPEAPDAS